MNQTTLALADGTVFHGSSFGSKKETVGEVVFNTSMFGYQEILTDPSYVGQIVTMAYPHIGNVGTNLGDEESERPHAVGMIAHAFSEPSNWRSTRTLNQYLEGWGLAGLEGIDTRKLVRHLRTHGAQMGVISSEGTSDKALVEKAKAAPGMEGLDLATGISTKKVYTWNKGSTDFLTGKPVYEGKAVTGPTGRVDAPRFKVVAIDYGLKVAMLHCLVDVGCEVTVVPAGTTAEQVLAYNPDGIFLTNGPGDPAAVTGADKTVAALLGKKPIFGICLGHQILALALGAKTWKMKFGHRGANQPVKDLTTGKVEITSQNHGFAVDAKTLGNKAQVTHLNLNDQTVEGLAIPDAQAWSVQYHPEASPGPHDARHLFGRFTDAMASRQ